MGEMDALLRDHSFFFYPNQWQPEEVFRSSIGLRQGEPLSSYPFVLDMYAFSVMVGKAVSEGLLSDKFTSTSTEEILISHLLFADDTLVVCKDSKDQMANINFLLLWFMLMFGLNINLDKSSLLHMGDVEDLALELDCKTDVLSTTI